MGRKSKLRLPSLPPPVELQKGQVALFGYGSLLSFPSIERTLGRRNFDTPHICWLKGWRRSWDILMPNDKTFFADTSSGRMYPQNIIYLNIRPMPEEFVIGILFLITNAELAAFDKREWIYNKEDVTACLSGVRIRGGPAFAYVGKPEFQLSTPTVPTHAAIRATYLEIIESGLKYLGNDFRTQYESSTDQVPQELVIIDKRA